MTKQHVVNVSVCTVDCCKTRENQCVHELATEDFRKNGFWQDLEIRVGLWCSGEDILGD